ncbi:MAG: ThiF family adenylyltransferase [Actinomycetota bacterium]|nr:ThiF family adenylyltransferase [Actinomycetota bacterium]
MSFDPFGHSPDLAALAKDGYELEITPGGHLLVKRIPFRTADGSVDYGTFVTKLEMNGDVTVNPVQDHAARFIGPAPCDSSGQPLTFVTGSNTEQLETSLAVDHVLSSKPDPPYEDYYRKVTAYVGLIEAQARVVDVNVSARTRGPCLVQSDDWPFEYVDTASGRAGIGAISARLAGHKVAIVGVGGTGSYVLDLVAKCPVDSIHLCDGDQFSTHNAFRAPGAASLEDLRTGSFKVDYLQNIYVRMKRNVVAHPYDVVGANADELRDMSFVFLAMEGGDVKRELVAALERMGLTFVDCSVGVVMPEASDVLLAAVQIAASTPENREMLHGKVDFGAVDDEDPYAENIQVAELNALNATMAVLWWKKHVGLYHNPTPYSYQRINVPFNQMRSE